LGDVNFGCAYREAQQTYQATLVRLPGLPRLGVDGHGMRNIVNGGDTVRLRAGMSIIGETQSLQLLQLRRLSMGSSEWSSP